MSVGYKIFNAGWRCRGLQYEAIGKTTYHKGLVKMCDSGLHYSQRALDCTIHYNLDCTNKFAEIKAGESIHDYNKSVTSELTIVRELSLAEFKQLCTGTRKEYYENLIRIRCEFVRGERNGLCELYNYTGDIYKRCNYANGELYGYYEKYDNKGNPTLICNYEHGKLHGVCEIFYNDGNIKSRRGYDNGKLLYEIYSDGRCMSFTYEHGVCQTK
jgi:hypothetical protein